MSSLSLAADAADDFAQFMQEAEEGPSEEAKAASEEASSASRGRGKKRRGAKQRTPKRKAKAKPSRRKSGGGDGKGVNSWKKCNMCNTYKEEGEFNDSQARCKSCFNDVRSLRRTAERQGLKDDVETMERDAPQEHKALFKAFVKARDKAKKNAEKIRFSIQSFRLTYRSSSGVRGAQEGEMMWEQEWYEEARRAKHGYLTREEAETKWKAWLGDPKHPKDSKGPRGYTRLWIKTADKLSWYDDISKDKELSKEEKLGKNAKESVLAARMQMLTGDKGLEKHELDFQNVQDKAASAMAGSAGGKDSCFAGDGLLGPDVEDILGQVRAKRKRTAFVVFIFCLFFCMFFVYFLFFLYVFAYVFLFIFACCLYVFVFFCCMFLFMFLFVFLYVVCMFLFIFFI